MDAPTTVAGNAPPRTGFLDLSAELKNKIYRLALCANFKPDQCIKLIMCRTPYEHGPQCMHRCKHTLVRYSVCASRLHLTPAILRACKQINTEAKSILYGENVFAMDLEALASSIDLSPGFKEVRFLTLGYLDDHELEALATGLDFVYKRNIAKAAMKAIEEMPKLRTLHIAGHRRAYMCYASSVNKMAQDMAENLRSAVKPLTIRSKRKVREVVTLDLEFSYDKLSDRFGDVNKMTELVYEELEASIERDGQIADDEKLNGDAEEVSDGEGTRDGEDTGNGEGEDTSDGEDTGCEEDTSDEEDFGDDGML